ncbi:MAG: nitrogen fixation protein NifE [Clostridiales Family XIII bacterium]|jgi:nitrogenase molybdenum-iron protein alpha chain|nr:nitrogen fixation protein NifE [Clostridiales Family XIII bacterium]
MPRTYSGIREQREYTDTYLDLAGSSLQIEQDFKKKCIKNADRTFSQSYQCQELNSISALLSVNDAVLIAHAPQGCVGCITMGADMYRVAQIHRGAEKITSPKILITNLDQSDVIMGGEGKLRESIRLASERYKPKLIFVFTSCASGIIGDDVDAIVREAQPDTEALIVPVHCDGFRSKICASGYDAAFIAISKFVLKGAVPKKEKGLINLFAPMTVSFADQLEIEKLLRRIGLKSNFLPFFSDYDKVLNIPNAEASTSICKVFADEFMKDIEHDFGIPYAHTVMPVGIRNTDKWYRAIAEITGKGDEVEEIIATEHARIQPELDKIKLKLQGKSVFICGGTGRSFAAATLIDDFGMKLLGIETPVYDLDAQDDIAFLNDIHGDYLIDVANMLPFEQVNIVNKLKPDVFIGVPSWSSRFGIPTTHILDPKRPTMGYDGIVWLGNKIAAQIENPGFNKKLSKYARLPYRESWYDEDPFKFIKEVI